MTGFMPTWTEVSIHTRKNTVSIPTEKFVENSKLLEKFSRDKNVFRDLTTIYCYQDGFVRLTYSTIDNTKETYQFYYPDFEDDLDREIEQIIGI